MFPVFQPESPQAQAIYDLFVMVLAISGGILALVAALIGIAVWRGRNKATLPEQDFGNHRSEIFWMVGPVIIVIWIAAISANLIFTINAVPKVHSPQDAAGEADITVIGHQWWWEIEHAGSGIVTANEIHIPAGRRIRVKLQSADVIHCFWVPQLARKMDAIPGRDNYLWLEANKPGTYDGHCAEFCGTQHAWMNFQVVALSESDFAAWEKEALDVPTDPKEADAQAGKQFFFAHTCANCHTIEGTSARATIGPDLTHIGSRTHLGGGVIENTPDNLRRWMKDPQAIKPGCKMPDFNLNDQQVQQVVAYLESLD